MAVTFESTSNPHFMSPTTAGWAAVTVGSGVWVNSSWVQLLASTPGTGIAVTGAVVRPEESGSPVISQTYEVELGTGASGSEVPFGVVIGQASSASNFGPQRSFRPLGIPYPLPAGVRVAGRLRKSTYNAGGSGELTWRMGLGYYALPLVGVSTTTQPQFAYPAASRGASVNIKNLPIWTWSAWTSFGTPLASDVLITGIEYMGETTELFEMELAHGASPTVLTRIRNRASGGTSSRGGPYNVDLYPPLSGLLAGETLSFRVRLSIFASADAYFFSKVACVELPL